MRSGSRRGGSSSAASPTTRKSPASRPGRSRDLRVRLQPGRPLPDDDPCSRIRPDGLGHRSKDDRVAEPGPVAGTAARFSPDSRRIALAHPDGEILIYDLETGRPRRFRSGLENVQDLAFRADGLQIAVTTRANSPPTCHILEVESGRVVRRSRCAARRRSPGARTAPPWRRGARISRSTSGMSLPASQGAARGLDQRRRARDFPPGG